MTVSSGNFAELLWPGIKEIFGNAYNDYEVLYTKVYETIASDKAFEKYHSVTGLPLAGIKTQGAPVMYVDPYQGYQRELINVVWALGSIVTREMYEDDQYNYINGIPKMLARSARQTMETQAWSVFNRATNASYTGADGSALAATNHPLVAGGTYSNLLTAADLTQTSFEVAIQTVMDAVDDTNMKIKLMPKTLISPTATSIRARKILQSAQVTGTNDNDVNVVKGICELVVVPWIPDSDSWAIVTDCLNGLIWQERRKLEFNRDNEFDTENLKFKMTWRCENSWVDPRCVYYNAGA